MERAIYALAAAILVLAAAVWFRPVPRYSMTGALGDLYVQEVDSGRIWKRELNDAFYGGVESRRSFHLLPFDPDAQP